MGDLITATATSHFTSRSYARLSQDRFTLNLRSKNLKHSCVFWTVPNDFPHTTASQSRSLSCHLLPGDKESPDTCILRGRLVCEYHHRTYGKRSIEETGRLLVYCYFSTSSTFATCRAYIRATTRFNRTIASSPSPVSPWPKDGVACGYRLSSEGCSSSPQWTLRR